MKIRLVSLCVLVSFLVASLTGCMAALPLVASGLLVGEVALTAIDLKEAMKAVDLTATFDIASNQVWEATTAAIEEMGIEIVEQAFDQETGNGIIKGKTNKHQNIQIIIVADTSSVTGLGVKARIREVMNMPLSRSDADITFSQLIIEKIAEHVEKLTGEKQEIRLM